MTTKEIETQIDECLANCPDCSAVQGEPSGWSDSGYGGRYLRGPKAGLADDSRWRNQNAMTAAEYKARRETLNLTQQELADLLGVHKITIAKREGGTHGISTEAVFALNWIEKHSSHQKSQDIEREA